MRDFTLAMRSDDSWHRRQRSKVILKGSNMDGCARKAYFKTFQVYLYLVPLLAIFYLIPSAQMVFMLEKVARETNQKVVSFTFDSQQISFSTLAVLSQLWLFSAVGNL